MGSGTRLEQVAAGSRRRDWVASAELLIGAEAITAGAAALVGAAVLGLSWLRLGRVLGLWLGIWFWPRPWLVARLESFLVLATRIGIARGGGYGYPAYIYSTRSAVYGRRFTGSQLDSSRDGRRRGRTAEGGCPHIYISHIKARTAEAAVATWHSRHTNTLHQHYAAAMWSGDLCRHSETAWNATGVANIAAVKSRSPATAWRKNGMPAS